MNLEEQKETAEKPVYELRSLSIPRIDLNFRLAVSTDKPLSQAFRADALVTNDHDVVLLFGTRLSSTEMINADTPCISLVIEVTVQIHFAAKLERMVHFKELPFAANILAALYPFIRERVHSCLADNGFGFFLGPLNLVSLVEQWGTTPSVMNIRDSRFSEEQIVNPG